MIGPNALYLYLTKQNQNIACKHNPCLIQNLIHLDKLASTKFKCICVNLPNFAIHNKSATLVYIQMKSGHVAIGNNYLREIVTSFAYTGYPKSLMVVSLDAKHSFASVCNKILLPIM